MPDENKEGATATSTVETTNGTNATGTNTEGAQGADKKGRPEFTPEQEAYFKKTIDAEFARINKKAEKKFEELSEAEKLKNMSIEDRTKAELETAKKKIAEYEKQQLISQFKVELTEKGLPAGFADHIVVSNAESVKAAVDFLSKHQASILKEKDEKIAKLEEDLRNANLRGTTPKQVGNPAPQETGKMSYSQIMQLAEKDPSIITKYTGGN